MINFIILFIALFFGDCAAAQQGEQAKQETSVSRQALVDSSSVKLPFEVPKNPLSLPGTAEIKTTKGSLIVKFYRKEAPISVANFAYLAKKNIYNNTFFHRYTPGFAIQGGDPTGTTKGGPGWNLPPEVRSGIKHQVGTIGWAMLPAEVNPERLSNGSQFYITLRNAPDLDNYYTVFAQVVRGLENLKKLRRGDKILSVVLDPAIGQVDSQNSSSSSSASKRLDWPSGAPRASEDIVHSQGVVDSQGLENNLPTNQNNPSSQELDVNGTD